MKNQKISKGIVSYLKHYIFCPINENVLVLSFFSFSINSKQYPEVSFFGWKICQKCLNSKLFHSTYLPKNKWLKWEGLDLNVFYQKRMVLTQEN